MLLLVVLSCDAQHTKQVASFKLPSASVVDYEPSYPASSGGFEPALLVTAFGPFGNDHVYSVGGLKELISSGGTSADAQVVAVQTWPNEAVLAPRTAVAGCPECVVVAGGFLVPGKSNGLVYLYNVSTPSAPVRSEEPISPPKKSYFYHQTAWIDVNGDGRLDLLAARATVPTFPWQKKASDLVWFEQPAHSAMRGNWTEHLIVSDGPDVAFALVELDGKPPLEVVATQFFTAKALSVWWCEASSWVSRYNLNQHLWRSD